MEFVGAIGLLFFLFLFWKLRQALGFFRSLKEAAGSTAISDTISPVEIEKPRWRHGRDVVAAARELEDIGFKSIAVYRIPEIQNLLWWAFMRDEDGLLAAITDHQMAGCSTEFVVPYDDHTSLTVSNNAIAGGLDEMPGHRKIYRRGVPVRDLLRITLQQMDGDKGVLRFDKESFIRHVCDAYAKETAWRTAKGGLNADEVQRNLAYSGQEIDDATARQVARISNERHLARLRESALAGFLDDNQISIARYEDWATRFLTVLEQDSPATLIGEIEELASLSIEQRARIEKLPQLPDTPAALRERIAEIIPNSCHLGHFEKPAPGDVYLLPEEES